MLALKILVLFAALGCQALVPDPTTTICPSTPKDSNFGDDSLCPNFQELSGVIEVNTLAELIQGHSQCDAKFRKAMSYYQTKRFQLVIQELQQSEAYVTLLRDLRSAGVDTSDIDNIMDIFDCLDQPWPTTQQPPYANKTCDCKQLRGRNFVGDLLAAMPNQEVHSYTAEARAKHNNFGLFADTISSPAFQSRLRTNMLKRDAMRPLRVLRRYGWNVPEMLSAAVSILSW
ncbi:PREDICTED: uncharacterized protein LOC108617183 [Drosophila arizonae]|uniref:Uncharacterized protein LOC108617183 n=1 Tax=Drosophila arizonae TaxID=7263 RepID=A0ABM1PME8_DROAR|nr:PREDICTED: uncharacterized protein LOC108617183 [Drosophila arizonae]